MSESELLDLDSPRDDDEDDDESRDLEPESLLLPLLLRWLLDDACEDDVLVLELLLASRLLELLLVDEEGRAVREADEDCARSRNAFDDEATAFLLALSLELLLGRVRVTAVFEVPLTTEREPFRSDDAEGLLADSRDRDEDDREGVRLAVIFDRLRSALLPPL
ncbi:MAG: hypothetical protein O3C21_14185 [Verrucomicrobia bacterium]|nr:hypothetical protein [Verrucomicrobiota bacterium]